jgi:hypothetical protein
VSRLEPTGGARPPLVVALAVAVVALLAVGVVAVARGVGDDEATAPAPASTTTTAVDEGPTTTETRGSTTVGPEATTTRPSGRATTSTSGGRGATTTTASTQPAAPVTTSPPGVVPACAAGLIRSTVASDRPSYRNGDTAHLTATFENVSGRPCSYPGTTATFQVITPNGQALTPLTTVSADNVDKVPFAPGTSQTFRSSWEVSVCSAPATCFPGRYTMVIDVAPFGGGRVSVDVT